MNTSILEKAASEESWRAFLEYKLTKQHLSQKEAQELLSFIDQKRYLPLCSAWQQGLFPQTLPLKRVVNKEGTTKKRIVYTFSGDEGILLKFIAFQLFSFDDYFCKSCYSFRRGYGVRDAVLRIRRDRCIWSFYCLKADVSNYFNSIDVKLLLEKLSFLRKRDPALYALFTRILGENRVVDGSQIVKENHGAMAGTPISPFFANVYLRDTDAFFEGEGVPYFRYSDDILLFAPTLEALEKRQAQLYERLKSLGLSINPEKVHISAPGEPFDFLGFSFHKGEADLSPNTIYKIKGKIKRKANALRRWQRRKGLTPDKAAIGFIRAMNRKFYGQEEEEDFTWSRWFFPNLTVDTGLRQVDAYLQQYLRYAATGRHTRGNYRIRYQTLKDWGYKSLVHEYYQYKNHCPFL